MTRFLSIRKILLILRPITACMALINSVFGAEWEEKYPQKFKCPITLAVMRDPVLTLDGYSYDREAIQKWFDIGKRTSPATGKALPRRHLIENHQLKDEIRSWIPGKQNISTPFSHLESSKIYDLIEKEFSQHSYLFNASKDKHIVAFVGNTGAGKSTLINFLARKDLRPDEDEKDYVLVNASDPTAMEIGTEGDSKTLYPRSIQVNDLLFFDLPGFNDTDESIRSLLNAAFIKQILTEAASVRLVFVNAESAYELSHGEPVKAMLDAINRLFIYHPESVDRLINRIIYVSTKSYYREELKSIRYMLRKTRSSTVESDLHRQLERWQNSGSICHYANPRSIDIEATRVRILDLIAHTEPTKIKDVNVSVLFPSETKDDLARMFLSVMEKELNDNIRKRLNSLSHYDHAIATYTSQNFWDVFGVSVCNNVQALSLLKEFCIAPYNHAIENLKKDNGEKRQSHILNLMLKRQEIVQDIVDIELLEKNGHLPAKQVLVMERPLVHSIPDVAIGYEAIYAHFIRGRLIYRPTAESDVGKIELLISDFLVRGDNPLESTFDLSGCGDAGQYLNISTGYRRVVKPENSSKWEVFITPKFLVERNTETTSRHYSGVVGGWTTPFSIIQNYGGWSDLSWYWHHGMLSENDLNVMNLYQICEESALTANSIPINLAPHGFTFNFGHGSKKGYFSEHMT